MYLLNAAYLQYLFALNEGLAPSNSAAGFSFRQGKVSCFVLVFMQWTDKTVWFLVVVLLVSARRIHSLELRNSIAIKYLLSVAV